MCILYNIGGFAPEQLRISGLCSLSGVRSMFELEFCLRPQAWLQPVDVKRLLGLHAAFGTRKESYMSVYVSI